ncbi:MAG: GNAT family N-acetyltransferase [Balneolaceae bacterium]
MKIIEVSENYKLIEDFLKKAKGSLDTFRYFQTRPVQIIKNHITTLMILENESPVCYGHLDLDNSTVWLGIAVVEEEKGKGYGNLMMAELLSSARKNKLKEVHLSVDIENKIARSVYLKQGFIPVKEKDGKLFMKIELG